MRKRLGGTDVKMLGYNGSIPGSTLRVHQGTTLAVRFVNEMDVKTTLFQGI